ncbi:MAG: hypothetical protein KKG93_17445 [Bacteroidetes bacterium]|nr:hypothetical protein [Bacteroidota bacterium]
MKKILLVIFSFCFIGIYGQSGFTEIAGKPGAFARLGFGARGKAMGNAMTSVIGGNLVSYYNPALSVFQNKNSFQSSYSLLSLDRSLNFVSFTRKFEFGFTERDGTKRDTPRSVAGLSLGLINASVEPWKGRDNQGIETEMLSPFENQFFIAFANRLSEKFSIGFGAKFYYTKLLDEVSSTSFGFDIGVVYRFTDQLTFGVTVSDINSKYKWDTSKIYGQEGTSIQEKFPVLNRLGVSYKFYDPNLLISLEIENSNANTNFVKFGSEYLIIENLFLRGGFDNLDVSNIDNPIRPSAGFSYYYSVNSLLLGVDYAFVIEPYSAYDQHIIGININF